MWERCPFPTRAGTPDLGNKRLGMDECLEDFIIRIQVSERVLLKHIDRAWIMERKISKDIRSRNGLSNCTGDHKINTKIRYFLLLHACCHVTQLFYQPLHSITQ